jgi:hypothetical protein
MWTLTHPLERTDSSEPTVDKLMEVSAKAQERARLHDEGYALITAQNAAAAAERGKQRAGGTYLEIPLSVSVNDT